MPSARLGEHCERHYRERLHCEDFETLSATSVLFPPRTRDSHSMDLWFMSIAKVGAASSSSPKEAGQCIFAKTLA